MKQLYIANAIVEVVGYMDDNPRKFNKFHTVNAESEKDAVQQIIEFYTRKTDEYSVYYSVRDISFFEHIEL